ncbi:MAG: hypothetical protein ABIK65_05335 [Candidatus Eisenbacteria bacterium]
MTLLLLILFALAIDGRAAPASDELPEPEPPILTGAAVERLDPKTAPLPLLSALRGVGRAGAARIGRARSLNALPEVEDLAFFLGVPPGDLDERIALPSMPVRAGFRTRRESCPGGVRALHAAEARAGPFAAGFLAERDAREARWNDLSLAGFSWTGVSARVVAGDLRVRLGGGLLVGTHEPFGTPAGFGPSPPSRLERYRSRSENRAHRGIGVRVRRRGEWIFLLTSTVRDARVDDDGFVSSFDDAGLHRTPEESARKDRSGERIAACRWEGGGGRDRIGMVAAAARFDPPLGGGDLSRKPNAFRGSRLSAVSVDLRVDRGRFLGEGEAALTAAGGGGGRLFFRAAAAGWKGVLRLRHYGPDFHAPRSAGYHRVGSEPNGESGAIFLVGGRGPGKIEIHGRVHRYATEGRTWRSSGPVLGTEGSVRLERGWGAVRLFAGAGSAVKSEVLGGVRREGGSIAFSAGGTVARGPWRLRADLRAAASRSPGGTKVRRARGLSLLLSRRLGPGASFTLSCIALPEADRVLLFPVPHLPGSSPVAWFGGGHEEAGFRASASGFPFRPVHLAVAAGPGGPAFELSVGLGGG